jgi:uroporphyrin-III C-methyltransferase/precorrin-2 dehydrogenase/sirohydrochlorin ferrochelatase
MAQMKEAAFSGHESGRAAPAPFPAFLDLDGARVLLVGSDPGKEALLRRAGAAVDRVPLAGFSPDRLAGARLCIIAAGEESLVRAAAAAARGRGVLVNAVDRPALSDFSVPAIVDRAPVTVAISTGGCAPALARRLRAAIEAMLPPGYGRLAIWIGHWRTRLRQRLAPAERRALWEAVLDGAAPDLVLAGATAQADALVERQLRGAARPTGSAALVGAGPGDPELLTLRAKRLIERADVILYDKLVGPGILDLARREARRVDVGKRCGRHEMSQAAINRLLVEEVRRGHRVVRLKGGDPFVFGRGGEELAALRAAGVEVEIVPGITAALAAASRLKLPLTHRGLARTLHLATAHGAALDWRALAGAEATLALYMGARTLGEVAAKLVAAGRAPTTPVAAIENATRTDERHVAGTLADIAQRLAAAGFEGPTLVLVGEVVGLAAAAEAAASAQRCESASATSSSSASPGMSGGTGGSGAARRIISAPVSSSAAAPLDFVS